jgi:hypothetical protein
MARTFKADPFELSPDQKAARKAEARAERLARRAREEDRHWEAGTGPASDGRVLDAIGNWGNQRAMGNEEVLDRTTKHFFEDPDAALGGLAAGVGEQIRIRRGNGAAEQAGPAPEGSPPLELRMPRV